jgi:hypothetical protein
MQGDQARICGESYLVVVRSTCARAIGWPDSEDSEDSWDW